MHYFFKFCSYLCYQRQNGQNISILVTLEFLYLYTKMEKLKSLKQKQKQESCLSLVLLYIYLTHKSDVFKIYEQNNLIYC